MTKLQEQIKERSIQALTHYWNIHLGPDYDQGPRMPEWIEIQQIIQAIREYNHNPETCQHNFNTTQWGEEKGLSVCVKCGTPEPEEDEEA